MKPHARGLYPAFPPPQSGVFWGDADLQPHLSRYWLNAKTRAADPQAFAAHVGTICTLYAYAILLATMGVHVISCDEMTGIQALERAAPTQPMQPGQPERAEFEYVRHGTLSLIANFEVATGQIVAPSLGPSRTEADFAAHIGQTIDSDPEGVWVFITDQLNTHQSETLVHLVAERCGVTAELGVKGKSGILESMASRAAFLSDPTHRIQLVYVPKHTSWLNQIEIWFSILVRRVIKRGNFTSQDDLRAKILAFVDYFNCTAKPFRWTYAGRPLQA
jgi:transposase